MEQIKPIETYYNGYRFRSRLEARWAVFFDVMHIDYYYEHEGYERKFADEKIMYLPDFYFPEYELFGEVKGATTRGEISPNDARKISQMIDYGGPCMNGVIFFGNIPNPHGATAMEWAVWKWTGESIAWGYSIGPDFGGISWDTRIIDTMSAPHWFESNDGLMLTSAIHEEFCDEGVRDLYQRTFPIEKALTAARQARFEHGEKPQ